MKIVEHLYDSWRFGEAELSTHDGAEVLSVQHYGSSIGLSVVQDETAPPETWNLLIVDCLPGLSQSVDLTEWRYLGSAHHAPSEHTVHVFDIT